MDLSDQTLALVAALIAAPIIVMELLNLLLKKRGGFGKGWGGAVFIGLCWIVAFGVIVTRIAH